MASGPERPADTRWERVCGVCDGVGWLDSPAWGAWRRERSELSEQALGAADRRVGGLLHELVDRHRRHPPAEPERFHCTGCGGLGAVTTTDGGELLAFLRRHLRT